MCPVARLPSSVLSLTRCASPPDKRRRGLTETHVAETDVDQRLQLTRDRRLVLEERERLFGRHVEHVGDALALPLDVERVAVVARALAHLTRHVDVGEEVHLDLDRAVALTRLAAAALHVEREATREIPAHLRFLRTREERADLVEHAGIRRGVRTGRAPDRRLVDVDDLVEILDPFDALVSSGYIARAVDLLHQRRVENVTDERALAAPAHTGDRDEASERKLDVDLLEIVLTGTAHSEPRVARLAA